MVEHEVGRRKVGEVHVVEEGVGEAVDPLVAWVPCVDGWLDAWQR